jgi:GTP:adenosylcobinamide-phosphate guanylyltransferase
MRVSDPTVVLGVNTPQELKRAWKILEKQKKGKRK